MSLICTYETNEGSYNTCKSTIMIPSFLTDRSRQIVKTHIRLLLEEQSDQGFHCLPGLFSLCQLPFSFPPTLSSSISSAVPFVSFWTNYPMVWPLFEFYVDYSKVFSHPKIKEL